MDNGNNQWGHRYIIIVRLGNEYMDRLQLKYDNYYPSDYKIPIIG